MNPRIILLFRIEDVLADPVGGEHGSLEGHVHGEGGEVGPVEGTEALGVVDVPSRFGAG